MNVCEKEKEQKAAVGVKLSSPPHPSPLLGHWAYASRGSLVNTPVNGSRTPARLQGRWPGAWGWWWMISLHRSTPLRGGDGGAFLSAELEKAHKASKRGKLPPRLASPPRAGTFAEPRSDRQVMR